MKEKINSILIDLNTLKNILHESSPHEFIDGKNSRPVNCKCGHCFMETLAVKCYGNLNVLKGKLK